jgi:hypothetical protein
MSSSPDVLSQLLARYADLEYWIAKDDRWLNAWTAMVVIGVALELFAIWDEYREDLKEFGRGIIRPPDKPSMVKLIVELLGAGLVVFGVAGEFFVTRAIGENESEIRVNSRQQVSIADSKAAAANLEAATLRKAASGRDLTLEQQRTIVSLLTGYAGEYVVVRSYPNDPEAKALGAQIVSALRSAHIDVEPRLEEIGFWTNLTFGIEVQCGENAIVHKRPFAQAIISALSSKDAGNLSVLPLSVFACPSDTHTEVVIGIKPPALLDPTTLGNGLPHK